MQEVCPGSRRAPTSAHPVGMAVSARSSVSEELGSSI
jgi:hypothetical protein